MSLLLAGARGIEPRSKVLETFILTVVLCPYVVVTRISIAKHHDRSEIFTLFHIDSAQRASTVFSWCQA